MDFIMNMYLLRYYITNLFVQMILFWNCWRRALNLPFLLFPNHILKLALLYPLICYSGGGPQRNPAYYLQVPSGKSRNLLFIIVHLRFVSLRKIQAIIVLLLIYDNWTTTVWIYLCSMKTFVALSFSFTNRLLIYLHLMSKMVITTIGCTLPSLNFFSSTLIISIMRLILSHLGGISHQPFS